MLVPRGSVIVVAAAAAAITLNPMYTASWQAHADTPCYQIHANGGGDAQCNIQQPYTPPPPVRSPAAAGPSVSIPPWTPPSPDDPRWQGQPPAPEPQGTPDVAFPQPEEKPSCATWYDPFCWRSLPTCGPTQIGPGGTRITPTDCRPPS
jgi:hypothetical protein